MTDKDTKHLEWLYDRLKFVHGENENYDYMIKFREIIQANKDNDVKLLSDFWRLAQRYNCDDFIKMIKNVPNNS